MSIFLWYQNFVTSDMNQLSAASTYMACDLNCYNIDYNAKLMTY